ncbi:division/cell wall cluster transcriptional repressor MraZ [Paracoccaceae bacterium GXU_MW_L88]
MNDQFRGSPKSKVDTKGRMSIPAQFRRVLEEGDPTREAGKPPTVILVWGPSSQPYLEGYSRIGMNGISEMIAALPRFSDKRKRAEKLLFRRSVEMQLDDTGRIVLSKELRDKIGVSGEVQFSGMGESFQIWSPDAFDADEAMLDDDDLDLGDLLGGEA